MANITRHDGASLWSQRKVKFEVSLVYLVSSTSAQCNLIFKNKEKEKEKIQEKKRMVCFF